MNAVSCRLVAALAPALLAAPLAHATDADARAADRAPALVAQSTATPGASACPGLPLSFLQRRILEKAAQGPAALRQYVWITRSLYGLDIRESFEFAERHRAAMAACGRAATG